jgi:TonB family protein
MKQRQCQGKNMEWYYKKSTIAVCCSVALHLLVASLIMLKKNHSVVMPQQIMQINMLALPNFRNEAVPQPEKKTNENKKEFSDKKPLQQKKQAEISSAKSQVESLSKNSKNQLENNDALIITEALFDAEYLKNPAPEYPAHAKRRGMQGTVMLEVGVSKEGLARSVEIIQSSGFTMLDESAKRAVSKWNFIPAKRGDEIIEAQVIVPIEFRLD